VGENRGLYPPAHQKQIEATWAGDESYRKRSVPEKRARTRRSKIKRNHRVVPGEGRTKSRTKPINLDSQTEEKRGPKLTPSSSKIPG